MREADPASPDNWSSLKDRIDAAQKQWQEHRKRHREQRRLFGKIKFETGQLVDAPETDSEGRWKTIVTAAAELVDLRVPPSNRELRELLLPVLDDMPLLPEVPPQFELVLREVDRYLAGQDSEEPLSTEMVSTEEVKKVAKKLRGKSLVLIGGDCRPYAEEALRSAFKLANLHHVGTRPGESVATFEASVARSDVVAVLLAIRWSRHSYGDVSDRAEIT